MAGFTSRLFSPLRSSVMENPGNPLAGFSQTPRRGSASFARISAPLPMAVCCVAALCLAGFGAAVLSGSPCMAQVFTVGPAPIANSGNLATVHPTSVPLGDVPMTTHTREELIRLFQSEEAFAVRPVPMGHRGLALHANGMLSPSGNAYVDELQKDGISVKPGGRVIISKFEIKPDRIVFEFNGGPDKHHRFLQHIQIGMVPLAYDDGQIPVGSRFTLLFNKFVPEMTAAQLRALIAPILDFSLKTPDQAFADTLPPKLRNAVLNHQVLVGMNRDMVLHAVGRPGEKDREMDGQTPIEIWIYGKPPHEVQFVRFNGNRVTRLEIADVGQPLIVRDKDETNGYFAGEFVHQVRLGDAPVTGPGQEEAPSAPPTLRKPGEQLPDVVDQQQQLKPVQFPKDSSKKSPEPPPIPPPPEQAPSDQAPLNQGPGRNPADRGPAGQGPAGQAGPGQRGADAPMQNPTAQNP